MIQRSYISVYFYTNKKVYFWSCILSVPVFLCTLTIRERLVVHSKCACIYVHL